jgi:hypothetical protein
MPIEKAFAIDAPPAVIYDAIERDLAAADAHSGSTWEALRRDPPHALDLRVTIGGVPCELAYRITPEDDYTEVSATLTPYGLKHAIFRIITFGMQNQGFEAALVQSLANLKESVEGERRPVDDEASPVATPADE